MGKLSKKNKLKGMQGDSVSSMPLCENKKNNLRAGRWCSVSSVSLCETQGFTLIEMIVALLIFGILSIILFSTLIQIQRRTSTSTWKNELTEEGVKICNIIRRELTGTREILYADEDSISFFNQEGELSSFYVKDSLLFKSKKRLVSAKTKLSSFKFIYYLPNDIIGETASPIYSLPLDAINLQRITVIDWKIGLKKGITSIHLKTGIFTRNIRQQ